MRVRYLALGWSGHVPQACRHNLIAAPLNLRWAYWGWPNGLIARADVADSGVMVAGPVGKGRPAGLTDPRQLDVIPTDFPGLILTGEIETIGPALRVRG